MSDKVHDLFIIGGGINGCGIARDAQGRGYSVFLAEMNDLASGTSSWSTKLIHGGLRYLEHYEFRLVRESLMEREVLWANAPHIIWPLRFVLPHHKGLRPAWFLRLGLLIYDHLGGRKLLPATKTLDMQEDVSGKPLKPLFSKAFEYSDCWVNDARLVALNACDAAKRGAEIRTRTKVIKAERHNGIWHVVTRAQSGAEETISARMLINAGGPWVDQIIAATFGKNDVHNVRLVQGSHIVVKRMFEHEKCYIFQNADNRIIFAIPYERDFTLIGTTDQDYKGDPKDVAITDAETEYLLNAASEYFKKPVKREDIVWTYSGVRPLFDDGASKAQEATRDYVLKTEGAPSEGVVLNIFGGKITTYRRLAESVLEKVETVLGAKNGSWTKTATLPGGDFPVLGFDAEVRRLQADYSFLNTRQATRLMRLYGTKSRVLLGQAASAADLGPQFGPDLTGAEVEYLVRNEWATTADDVLWRRTKAGLGIDAEAVTRLQDFIEKHSHVIRATPGAAV
ncbi:MAG: glycerol-3-phosphate dehydrogenase [Rhizobiaceae bacterium]